MAVVGVHDSHPLVISSSATGPDRRRNDEVFGTHPASGFDMFSFTPQAATPAKLWYQSVSQSGVGGAIHIQNTPEPEPQTLLGASRTSLPFPSSLLFWDEHGITLHRWLYRAESPGGAEPQLNLIGHLPLASLTRAVIYNQTFKAFRVAYDAAMALAPKPPNVTYFNVTNSTNQTIAYIRDGVVVNETNITAEWLAFEKTLPTMEPVPLQSIAAAVIRPRTSELFWSTTKGHLLTGRLAERREYVGGFEKDEGSNSAGRISQGRLERLEIFDVNLLILGNATGLDDSPWKGICPPCARFTP